MKTIYIPAKSKLKLDLSKVKIKGKFGLATTSQYLYLLKDIKLKNSVIAGQVLGCDASACKKLKVDSFLFIGTGHFHPIRIALETKKPVYILNPVNNEFYQLDNNIIEDYERKIKIKQKKFLFADTIGILVSTKPGQENLKEALRLKENLKKKSYILLFNSIEESEFENFPKIDFWVNTACKRIESNKIINLEDLP